MVIYVPEVVKREMKVSSFLCLDNQMCRPATENYDDDDDEDGDDGNVSHDYELSYHNA